MQMGVHKLQQYNPARRGSTGRCAQEQDRRGMWEQTQQLEKEAQSERGQGRGRTHLASEKATVGILIVTQGQNR